MKALEICPGLLTLDHLYYVFKEEYKRFELKLSCGEAINASVEIVSKTASGGIPVYGVNTGFGKLATTTIDREAVAQLHVNLVSSHCVRVGSPLASSTTRLMMGGLHHRDHYTGPRRSSPAGRSAVAAPATLVRLIHPGVRYQLKWSFSR